VRDWTEKIESADEARYDTRRIWPDWRERGKR
jgi:hypothetical protein